MSRDVYAENVALRAALASARDTLIEIGETCWDNTDKEALRCACDTAGTLSEGEVEAINTVLATYPAP